MKICTKCKVEKDESLFSKNRSRCDGLSSICKDCHAKYCVKYYSNNKDKLRDYSTTYRLNNLEKTREAARLGVKRSADDLSRMYIIKLIKQNTRLKPKDIPIELIEAKRMQMMINRKLKEMNK